MPFKLSFYTKEIIKKSNISMQDEENIKVIETGDGSSTLYNKALNETYHSSHGALTESIHVFIQAGFEAVIEHAKNINILEIGFGTGLNAILTLQEALKRPDCNIVYTSLEPYPVEASVINNLNYKSLLDEQLHPYFDKLHEAEWDTNIELLPNFILHKANTRLEDFVSQNSFFNLVYFDAFAPSKQPDMWTVENMSKCFELSQDNSLLVSYCANGQFKRNLKAAGFEVEKYPGPPGKREMTRAKKGNLI